MQEERNDSRFLTPSILSARNSLFSARRADQGKPVLYTLRNLYSSFGLGARIILRNVNVVTSKFLKVHFNGRLLAVQGVRVLIYGASESEIYAFSKSISLKSTISCIELLFYTQID